MADEEQPEPELRISRADLTALVDAAVDRALSARAQSTGGAGKWLNSVVGSSEDPNIGLTSLAPLLTLANASLSPGVHRSL